MTPDFLENTEGVNVAFDKYFRIFVSNKIPVIEYPFVKDTIEDSSIKFILFDQHSETIVQWIE